MQENKFENRVQQQMEGFHIRPSGEVWEKVEKELRKKKKRRVVFYIFFLAGAFSLIGYSGYFLSNKTKSTISQRNTSKPVNPDNPVKNDGPVLHDKTPVAGKQPSLKEDQSTFDKQKNNTTADKIYSQETGPVSLTPGTADENESLIHGDQNKKTIEEKAKKPATRENLQNEFNDVSVNNNAVGEEDKTNLQTKPPVTKAKEKADQPVVTGKEFAGEKQIAIAGEKVQPKEDSVAKEIAIMKNSPPTAKEDMATAKEKIKKTVKMNWGIELSGGVSASRENVFSFTDGQKSLNVADFRSPPLMSNNNSLASPPIVYLPSAIKPGPSFSIGLTGEIQLSKRSSLSSGLRYAYFSNNIKVGAYKDTAVSFSNSYSQAVQVGAIYRGYHQEDYTNRFHFIQLPLQYHLQLNKGIKIPITWNIGGSAGYLISTDALVYDTAARGIYYHDKAAFNKFHWNLNTGFSFRFGNKNKIKWSLGPELSLAMNKLTKDNYARNQFLLYGGITGKVIFSKKK